MEQVRRAVIGTNAVAARGIDAELHGIADLERARLQLRLMRVQAAERLARIADGRLRPLQRRDRPRVAYLAAALAIEGRLVGQHGDIVARLGFANRLAVLDQPDPDRKSKRLNSSH